MTIDATAPTTFDVARVGDVDVVTFSGTHHSNAMSSARMAALSGIAAELEADPGSKAVVLCGGPGRSFAVGGDFNEVSDFHGGEEVDAWIDQITDLYVSLLSISKPVVAAIDGYAIGIGLQIALTCDYRIGSDDCLLKMPEFDLGIACNFGGYMLERSVGRHVMQHMLMSAAPWPARRALRDGLLHETVESAALVDTAVKTAAKFATYNPAAFRATKPRLNAGYADGLHDLRRDAKKSHRAGFSSGVPQRRMRAIVDHGA